MLSLGLVGGAIAALAIATFLAIAWRRVVPPNMAHIVQTSKKRTTYGVGTKDGNTYYDIPSWIPFFGVTVIRLPVNNFDLRLDAYEAYDKDRAPFLVDVVGFFRIEDTGTAAARIESYKDLEHQLELTMQGAVRTILARHDVEAIMIERATFGEQFTAEVTEGLKEWGVVPVRNLELMDIRDTKNSTIIADIMAKKSSTINMQSRVEVAQNKRKAEIAEIEADQAVELREQEKVQAVGERTAAQEQAVGIAKEKSSQAVQTEAAETAERTMAVKRVETVRNAEIEKQAGIVEAEQDKEMAILDADAKLEAAKRNAEGVKVEGAAKADAERLILLAPVEAQITLAKEIGQNAGYQTYLVSIEQVAASKEVGLAQAAALQQAEIKVIANTGQNGASGLGLQVGALLEGLVNTPQGAAVLGALTPKTTTPPNGADTAH